MRGVCGGVHCLRVRHRAPANQGVRKVLHHVEDGKHDPVCEPRVLALRRGAARGRHLALARLERLPGRKRGVHETHQHAACEARARGGCLRELARACECSVRRCRPRAQRVPVSLRVQRVPVRHAGRRARMRRCVWGRACPQMRAPRTPAACTAARRPAASPSWRAPRGLECARSTARGANRRVCARCPRPHCGLPAPTRRQKRARTRPQRTRERRRRAVARRGRDFAARWTGCPSRELPFHRALPRAATRDRSRRALRRRAHRARACAPRARSAPGRPPCCCAFAKDEERRWRAAGVAAADAGGPRAAGHL
jgi:hypothetical protein